MKTPSSRIHRSFIITLILLIFTAPAYSESRDLAKFERAKSFFRQGTVYFNNMQYLASVEYFRKAVAAYPDYYTAREYLARAYRLSGFKEEAIAEWEMLSGVTTNNVLIQRKIDMLRLQEMGRGDADGSGDFVLADEYISSEFKRFRFTNPVDVAVDNDRNVFITSFGTGKLVKIDPNREGMATLNPSLNSKLYGIDYFNKRLAVSDFQQDCVYIMNTDPKVLKTIGSSGNGEGKFHGPQGVCYDRKGYIYVADSGNHRVQKFDPSGNFILSFGRQGEYEGELQKPSDCAAGKDTVYVTDTGNSRIACFDDSGNFLKNIKLDGFEQLRGITLQKDTLLVSDEKSGLMFYNVTTEQARWFKSWENDKRSIGRLYSALFDPDNFLYCLDYKFERLYIFSPLERRYTNFDVEISSVDAHKFPVVAFYLNVRDQHGKPLYGLKRENFTIIEDSARIQGIYVDYLKDRDPSASMVMCVDRSEAMRDLHNDLPWVAEFLLTRMRKNDALKLTGFNKDEWVDNDFDWSRRRTLKALKKKDYAGGKNIGKALYNSIAYLLPKNNRRGVIFITDGTVSETSFSQYSAKNIIEFARGHHIPIYIISFHEADQQLIKIAAETGGALYTTRQVDSLRTIYERIKNSDEYRYILVYSTFKMPSLKGWWSDVKIEVNYKGQKGKEWGGYFVP